ncbi:platelet-activating factor receptor-like [Phocoena phocoena]|uniref:platelet-activating factor receptor-like n=1 Tax=Phocoena phocoena TaxID=9742 RepID=UPI003307445D
MNSSAGDLGVGAGGRSPWGDPAGFIVVPTAYALVPGLGVPGLGLPANVAALAVFVRRGRRLGQALRLHLLNLAMADVLVMLTLTLWLTYYLGLTHWPFPEAACRVAGTTYCVSTYAALAFAALTSVCRCGSLAGQACAAPSLATPHALRPRPGSASAGLAYATVVLVLAAYVSLARVLAAPSGPGPALAPAGTNRRAARTMVLGHLLVFALCLAPYHLLLAPWVAGQEGTVGRDDRGCQATSTLDVLHTLSLALLSLNSCLDPLIYCFSVRSFCQDCWALSCLPGLLVTHDSAITSTVPRVLCQDLVITKLEIHPAISWDRDPPDLLPSASAEPGLCHWVQIPGNGSGHQCFPSSCLDDLAVGFNC